MTQSPSPPFALLLFGIALLLRRETGLDSVPALGILGIAGLWLSLVTLGMLHGELARWSPLAVFLLAIGIETRARRRTGARRENHLVDRQATGPSRRGTDTSACEELHQPDVA